jgi:transcriptional regulator with XRE-family HTH domain
MTHQPRKKPKKLASKLLRIREALGLTQAELAKVFKLNQKQISHFESGEREPNLLILAKYADLVNICTDVLIRDEINLPLEIPQKKLYHIQ